MKKILIVDDDPEVVELVRNRLEANHYEVASAADGQIGIKKAQKEKPDLILMDIMMPNLPGGDTVRLLKADLATKHIPVIFLTAVTSNMPQGQEAKGINVDGQFFIAIAKPFKSEKLLFEIRRLIENEK